VPRHVWLSSRLPAESPRFCFFRGRTIRSIPSSLFCSHLPDRTTRGTVRPPSPVHPPYPSHLPYPAPPPLAKTTMASTTATPSAWWTASLESNILALSLTRITPPPVSTFDAIDSKFKIFEKTYHDLLEILRRVRKTVDVLDNLNYCSLHQTLDEYDDFKYDADVLRQSPGAGERTGLFKRTIELPTPISYQIPRYVYNDNGIRQLENKIGKQDKLWNRFNASNYTLLDWQIRIMKATMSDIVL
jgi:hypothetical protein